MSVKMKNTIFRGRLLEFLHDVYPEGVEERTIIEVFYAYYRYEAILHALEYLCGKGYVEKKEQPHPYKQRESIKVYKLDHKGVDLLEGTICDAGITIVPHKD